MLEVAARITRFGRNDAVLRANVEMRVKGGSHRETRCHGFAQNDSAKGGKDGKGGKASILGFGAMG